MQGQWLGAWAGQWFGRAESATAQPDAQPARGGGSISGRGRRRRIYLPDIVELQDDRREMLVFRLPSMTTNEPSTRRSARRRRAEELVLIALNGIKR